MNGENMARLRAQIGERYQVDADLAQEALDEVARLKELGRAPEYVSLIRELREATSEAFERGREFERGGVRAHDRIQRIHELEREREDMIRARLELETKYAELKAELEELGRSTHG